MLSIYWSWVLIGFVVGLAFGVAVSFFVTWLVEKQTIMESGSDFERGFNRGWECGKAYQQRKEDVKCSDTLH